MENYSNEELNILIIGIRLQIDECEKQRIHNYDPDIRKIYEDKRKNLYELWKKLEQTIVQTF
jgi:hypothetical protein